jgi:hypothetical protein
MPKNGYMFVFKYKMLLIYIFLWSIVASFYTIRRKIACKIKNVSNKFSHFLSSEKVSIFSYIKKCNKHIYKESAVNYCPKKLLCWANNILFDLINVQQKYGERYENVLNSGQLFAHSLRNQDKLSRVIFLI